jgi:hypothetical protein
MIKVVYNAKHGGFGLSKKASDLYTQKRESAGLSPVKYDRFIERHDPLLVEVVQELGNEANGMCANLKIEEIPEEYLHCYTLEEYDGLEGVECYPSKLVEYKLKKLKIGDLTDEECRKTLQEMINIVSNSK